MSIISSARIGVGTAQFGMPYGVANRVGRPSEVMVHAIIKAAERFGMSLLDTAPGYGGAEEVLGRELPDAHRFRIVTKLPVLTDELTPDEHVERSVASSLGRLRQHSIYGLLVHDVSALRGPHGRNLVAAMKDVRERGLVRRIGVSVYTASDVQLVLTNYDLDIVQLPINVLDQRLVRGGQLSEMKSRGMELYGRSIFLQGLLLMDPAAIPEPLRPRALPLQLFRSFCESRGHSALEVALAFALGIPELDAVICGIETVDQLTGIVAALRRLPVGEDFSSLAVDDELLLDPSKWRLS